jgi:hypothetical protein
MLERRIGHGSRTLSLALSDFSDAAEGSGVVGAADHASRARPVTASQNQPVQNRAWYYEEVRHHLRARWREEPNAAGD